MLALMIICIYFISPVTFAANNSEKMIEEWRFYHEELISNVSESSNEPVIVNLPIEFDDLNLPVNTYGTFIKTVTIPEHMIEKQMGIELPYVYSAAAIYIDGEKIIDVGQVGSNRAEHETDLQTVIASFVPKTATFEVAIQLSSFDHIRGGFSAAPIIGEWEDLHQKFLLERYVVIFVGTLILIVGLATFMIGLLSRKEKLYLTFGLFSIFISLRGAVAVPFIYHELPFPISYVLATKLEYITTPICFALYAIFIFLLYNRLFSKWYLFFNLAILFMIVIVSVFTEPVFFQKVFFSVFPLIIVFVVYNIWIMFKALKRKMQLAKSLLLGIFFVLIGLVVDFMSGIGYINIFPIAQFMIALNVLIVLYALCMNYVNQMNALSKMNGELDDLVKERTTQLNRVNAELQRLAITDALTNVYNRHMFDERLQEYFEQAELNDSYLSLLMIDLDEFKKYNDYYGHVKGDELLTEVAQLIQQELTGEATFARYGGEEFSIILPNIKLEDAVEIAERIRQLIESKRLENLGRDCGIVTVSIGCAEKIHDQIKNKTDLIKVSDERLYMSKVRGRNRVTAQSNK